MIPSYSYSYILKLMHHCFVTFHVFTALHGMQTRSSDENSVCPYVCLSVLCPSGKRVNCDKTEENSVPIFIPYEKSFSLVY